MTRNHERLHRDEKDLRSLAMTELQTIYADLGLSQDELDLLSVPRRSFTVSFPVKMTRARRRCSRVTAYSTMTRADLPRAASGSIRR